MRTFSNIQIFKISYDFGRIRELTHFPLEFSSLFAGLIWNDYLYHYCDHLYLAYNSKFVDLFLFMNLFGASSTSNSLNTSKPKTYGTSAEVIRNHDFEVCNCIIHEVSMTDTIMKLAIKYNVTVYSLCLVFDFSAMYIYESIADTLLLDIWSSDNSSSGRFVSDKS